MQARTAMRLAILAGLILATAGCGRIGNLFGGGDSGQQGTVAEALERDGRIESVNDAEIYRENIRQRGTLEAQSRNRRTIWDLFRPGDDPNVTVEVNRYIWNATLDVLDFLPVRAADPFSGVLVFGYGTPPGGGRAYRATVYVQDPALDARSLRVAIATRSGAAPIETVRAVEDAILTRARQLRVADQDL